MDTGLAASAVLSTADRPISVFVKLTAPVFPWTDTTGAVAPDTTVVPPAPGATVMFGPATTDDPMIAFTAASSTPPPPPPVAVIVTVCVTGSYVVVIPVPATIIDPTIVPVWAGSPATAAATSCCA